MPRHTKALDDAWAGCNLGYSMESHNFLMWLFIIMSCGYFILCLVLLHYVSWFLHYVLWLLHYVSLLLYCVLWFLHYVLWLLHYVVCSLCDVVPSLCFVDFTSGTKL